MTTDITDTSIVHYFVSGIQEKQIKMYPLIIFIQVTFDQRKPQKTLCNHNRTQLLLEMEQPGKMPFNLSPCEKKNEYAASDSLYVFSKMLYVFVWISQKSLCLYEQKSICYG
uniref:Uncharacterized protein n=1 Tax=Micrurus spixii TaxID=129469 RepID=A0A2D4ME75_9SAUR